MSTRETIETVRHDTAQAASYLLEQPLIRRMQWVKYEPRTDQIAPVGSSIPGYLVPRAIARQFRGYSLSYELIAPVTGWAPYTHLIRWDGSAVYALAQF